MDSREVGGEQAAPLSPEVERGAACFHGRERACLTIRCGSNCFSRFDRMHPCPACLIATIHDLREHVRALGGDPWDSYNGRVVTPRAESEALRNLTAPDAGRPRCPDCGPGYRIGAEGCRHGDYQPELGETGVCRTCAQPIWWETGQIGHRDRVGWSDRIKRGGDSIVCFSAAGFRHVPMGGREAAIYKAGFDAGQKTVQRHQHIWQRACPCGAESAQRPEGGGV